MKRVNLAVSDDLYELLYALSEVRNQSMASIVTELLPDFVPGWKREVRRLQPIRQRERELETEIEQLRKRAGKRRRH